MQMPTKMTDSIPVYSVTDPSDRNATVVYNAGPTWLVIYGLSAAVTAAALWSATALVYWFVFIYGVVAGII
jgi:hypothetical protein